MKTAALLHKLNSLDPTKASAKEIVKMATLDGAKVLGKEKMIGSIEKGKRADLITINLDKPHLAPMFNPYSHLVYCVISSDVDNVIVNGNVIMRKRIVKTMDEEKIINEAKSFKIK